MYRNVPGQARDGWTTGFLSPLRGIGHDSARDSSVIGGSTTDRRNRCPGSTDTGSSGATERRTSVGIFSSSLAATSVLVLEPAQHGWQSEPLSAGIYAQAIRIRTADNARHAGSCHRQRLPLSARTSSKDFAATSRRVERHGLADIGTANPRSSNFKPAQLKCKSTSLPSWIRTKRWKERLAICTKYTRYGCRERLSLSSGPSSAIDPAAIYPAAECRNQQNRFEANRRRPGRSNGKRTGKRHQLASSAGFRRPIPASSRDTEPG